MAVTSLFSLIAHWRTFDYTWNCIQGAPRPREGIIPPELFSITEHQPHFCPF
jgi:hypothetical protein